MGVLTEVYLANDEEDALRYEYYGECGCADVYSCGCWTQNGRESFEYVDAKGVLDIYLALLLDILRGGGTGFPDAMDGFQALGDDSNEDEQYRTVVPLELRDRLLPLGKTELLAAARQWAKCEDLEGVEAEDLLEYLLRLQDLCKKSLELDKPMFLWVCV